MSSSRLNRFIKHYNEDYKRVTGTSPKHFVCPIRYVDEEAAVIEGHVIGQTLPNCSRHWVPQYANVDGVFGSLEAEFHKHFAARCEKVETILADKKLFKQVRPTLELGGVKLQYHVRPIGASAGGGAELVVHVPAVLVGNRDEVEVSTIIDRDDCAVALLVALHSAHLTMFRISGYEYALSATGEFIAAILNRFYAEARSLKRAERVKLCDQFYREFRFMHAQIGGDTQELLGTLEDKKFLCFFDETGVDYAWGIVVRFQDDRIVVLLPHSGSASHLYADHLCGNRRLSFVKPARFIVNGFSIESVELDGGDPIIVPIFDDEPCPLRQTD